MIGQDELDRRLGTDYIDLDAADREFELIRSATRRLAMLIDRGRADGREKSLALTALEESLLWTLRAPASELGIFGR